MIKTCKQCGAVNGETAEICCFCDASLGQPGRVAVSRRVATPKQGNLAVEPEWRREVSTKLNAYRARRGGTLSNLQSALPFETDFSAEAQPADEDVEAETDSEFIPPARSAEPGRSRQRGEHFEIPILSRESPADRGEIQRPSGSSLNHNVHPVLAADALFPVASLSDRRRAAFLDVTLLLFSFGGMLALFIALGGRIGFNRLDAVVAGATLSLFYAQYFALFTVFGGSTPGMMVRGLRVVSFDGSIPTSRQMAWRSFGYIVSAGTCLLGFAWALWDEDHLCWQDRMSHTYLTRVEGVALAEPSSEAPHDPGTSHL